jgi:hypothetical protein
VTSLIKKGVYSYTMKNNRPAVFPRDWTVDMCTQAAAIFMAKHSSQIGASLNQKKVGQAVASNVRSVRDDSVPPPAQASLPPHTNERKLQAEDGCCRPQARAAANDETLLYQCKTDDDFKKLFDGPKKRWRTGNLRLTRARVRAFPEGVREIAQKYALLQDTELGLKRPRRDDSGACARGQPAQPPVKCFPHGSPRPRQADGALYGGRRRRGCRRRGRDRGRGRRRGSR